MDLDPKLRCVQTDDLQAGRFCCGGLGVRVAFLPGLELRAEEELNQLEHARRTNVLGEVGAPEPEHASDLLPPNRRRVPAGDEIERLVSKGQRWLVRMRHDNHTTRMQQLCGFRYVWRPRLRRHCGGREDFSFCENLAAARLDVQRCGCRAKQQGELPGIPPGGRSSVARPFSQEKSQPDTSAEAPASSKESNVSVMMGTLRLIRA